MKIFKDYVVPILIAILLVFLLNRYVFKLVTVSGPSMEPNLENKEKIVVFPLGHINHLSVIVFNAVGEDPSATGNKDYYVKRVIGLPGDKVSFTNGKLYVNSKKVNQSFISKNQQTTGTAITSTQQTGNWNIHQLASHWPANRKAVKVPQGKYFVLGDHRSVSNDSRYWGFVDKSKILGVVHTLPWGTSQTEKRNINSLGY